MRQFTVATAVAHMKKLDVHSLKFSKAGTARHQLLGSATLARWVVPGGSSYAVRNAFPIAAMGIPTERIAVTVEGELDLRGNLGVSKEVPVGFESIHLHFDVAAPKANAGATARIASNIAW
jgi:hypothetical protein